MITKTVFTTFEAARMCHVSPLSIINWVNAGRISAFRTPGGHRRIRREDLLLFMRENGLPIPEELAPGGSKRRVLIADEDRSTREMLSRHLSNRARPFEVVTAATPFDTGRQLASLHPEVVVIDVRMVGLDAVQVCSSIQSDPKCAGTVVIATTTHPSPEVEARLLEAGAARCFNKPVDVEALATFIQAALDKPRRPKSRRSRSV